MTSIKYFEFASALLVESVYQVLVLHSGDDERCSRAPHFSQELFARRVDIGDIVQIDECRRVWRSIAGFAPGRAQFVNPHTGQTAAQDPALSG
ncbi:MAG TPA: hypothetical protein VMB85_23855 [Bryobacteraceae bacterium]|nr:hypothetical protein [Bryobacteraceae bacterium]